MGAKKLQEFEHMLERQRDSWRMRRRDDDDRKTYDEVFNKENLLRVYKLFTDGVIDRLDFPISTGKEGNVFRASTEDGKLLAVKIYRTSNATFMDMAKYINGDPRFKGIMTNRRKLILAWASKEFRNLQRYTEAGLRVPKAVARNQNIIVMEYIGDEVAPALELRNVEARGPRGRGAPDAGVRETGLPEGPARARGPERVQRPRQGRRARVHRCRTGRPDRPSHGQGVPGAGSEEHSKVFQKVTAFPSM